MNDCETLSAPSPFDDLEFDLEIVHQQINSILMKNIILFLLTGLFLTNGNAQTNRKDSLKMAIQKEKTDTGRVLLLSDLGFEYIGSNPDTVMSLAMEGLSLSQHIGYLKGEAVSLNRIGNAYGAMGNFPKEMESYIQSLKINEKINNRDGMERNLANIGVIKNEHGDYRLALDYLMKAKSLAEQINNKNSLSIVLCEIGTSYLNLKKIDSARIFTQQAYDEAYRINFSRIIGTSLNIMGNIHSEAGENKLALEYFRLSIPYLEKSEIYDGLSQTHLGIAKLLKKTGQNDSVFYYAKQSFLSATEKGFTQEILDASSFLSDFYRNRRDIDSAFYYQDIAKSAYDTLFSQQKVMQLQSIAFDERLRQQEIASAELKAKDERKNNLQFVAIAIGLITFIVLFFVLSQSIIVKTKFIEFFGVLGLLAVFEFINLYIHPYLAHATNDSPLLMLAMLIAIAALLIPLHHRLEKWVTKIMVEKNKKIRLNAALKTIEQLGGEDQN